MLNRRIMSVAAAAVMGAALGFAPLAMAQTADPAASAPTKAQKKAQRKAAHQQAKAKRTADLKAAEKAGYKPTAEEANYPNNVQGKATKAP
jgi:hypothetical protein